MIKAIKVRIFSQTHNSKIFTAAVMIGFIMIGVKLVSMVKELVIASTFGVGDELDAFLIAFIVPAFIINVIGGSMNSALIPIFVEVRDKNGKYAAQKLFSNIMVLSSGLLIGISVLLALLSPVILKALGSGFSEEKLELTKKLFYILLPIVLVNGIAITWSAILNAGERFRLAPMVSVAVPLVIIVTLLVGSTEMGIFSLAVGTLAGFALEAGMIGIGLTKHGMKLTPVWSGMDADVRRVIAQYIPMIASAVLMGSTYIIDNAMAAMLGSGNVAALNYGNRIVAVIIGLGAISLGTAVMPYYSRMAAVQDWAGLRNTTRMYLKLIFVATVPVLIVLVFFSEELVRILFERGAFTHANTIIVAEIQRYFLLQIPFYISVILLVKLISSLQQNKIFVYGAIVNVVLNIILNLILMRWIGVAGIALSTSVVYMVSSLYLYIMVQHILFVKDNYKKTHS